MPKNGMQSGLRLLCIPFFGSNPLQLRNSKTLTFCKQFQKSPRKQGGEYNEVQLC